jgi:hypothetical protein
MACRFVDTLTTILSPTPSVHSVRFSSAHTTMIVYAFVVCYGQEPGIDFALFILPPLFTHAPLLRLLASGLYQVLYIRKLDLLPQYTSVNLYQHRLK